MWFRFLVLASLIFCATMTTLLVRSVYFPEFDRLPEVEPERVFELFLDTHEPADIFIYRDGVAVADVQLTPRRIRDSGEVEVIFVATGKVALPGLAEQKLTWTGKLRLGEKPQRSVRKLGFTVKFEEPPVSVNVEIEPETMQFYYRVLQGGEIVSDSRMDPNAIGVVQAQLLMTAWGFSPSKVEAELKDQTSGFNWIAKHGTIEIAGHRVGAYFVVLEVPAAGEMRLTFSEAGELLQVENPLGYEMLSRALRTPPDPLPYQ